MAKSELRNQALLLRKSGNSIKEIARTLEVSNSTASIWCRDVVLSEQNKDFLVLKQKMAGDLGRQRGAALKMAKRLKEIADLEADGIQQMVNTTAKESFSAGLGLYWGEGLKTGGVTGIVNSDPTLIVFMINWFKEHFDVKTEDLICRVGINSVHTSRISEIEKHWSLITNIPLSQFTKPGLYTANQKKIYPEKNTYFGTLTVKVRKSTTLQRKILGLIKGLYLAA